MVLFFFFSQIIVAGIHKNDKFCEPIVCADDWKIKHLHEIVAFMKQWKVSQRPGLTKETFVAWIHTLSGLADLAVYLLKKHNFNYVLLGKFQSDPLEGRFGIYRQLNGASFFMSVRQVLLAEKKVRVLNLMQLQCLKFANENVCIDNSLIETVLEDVNWLSTFLEIPDQCNLNETDSNLVYYVAGFIGRSIGRVKKCEEYHLLLLLPMDYTESITAESSAVNEYSVPTEYCFAACTVVFIFFKQIVQDNDVHKIFMSKCKQRNLFVNSITKKCTDTQLSSFLETKCARDHNVFAMIAHCLETL